MNLGRFTIGLLVAAVIASAITGCGGDDASTAVAPTKPQGFATPSTGSKDGGTETKSTYSAPKAAKTDASGGASAKAPVELSKQDTKQVKVALTQIMKALSNDDAAYLCGEAYSKEFLAQMDTTGGCTQTLKDQLSSVNDISAKVQQMVWIQPNVVAASVILKRDTTAKLQKNPATLYFMKQDGAWKRTVQPKI
jgi:hypothetical protein